jgi:hypothetical protein
MKELGHFRLNELESFKLPWGLEIERDINFRKNSKIKS